MRGRSSRAKSTYLDVGELYVRAGHRVFGRHTNTAYHAQSSPYGTTILLGCATASGWYNVGGTLPGGPGRAAYALSYCALLCASIFLPSSCL